MAREDVTSWPPVDMVLRTPAGTAGAASSPAAAPGPDLAGPGPAGQAVDPAEVAERVFRMMQRDLRLERERTHGAGGGRWRSSR